MQDFLAMTLSGQFPEPQQGQQHGFTWHWLAEGVLELTPVHDYHKVVVLSAGIHGNETAPIELLNQLCADLFAGKLVLQVRLLIIFGNPEAMRQGQRYLSADLNRMFMGGVSEFTESAETARAKGLEQLVQQFMQHSDPQAIRLHYDLHTAIRASLFPTFGLLPYKSEPFDPEFLSSLEAADLDALVHHQSLGRTFSQLTAETCQASSCTLELGKALPFGCNDLSQFQATDTMLRSVVANQPLPPRGKTSAMRQFQVQYSLLKQHDDFKLYLSDDAPNFTVFEQGDLLCTQQQQETRVQHTQEWILFPNPNVQKGLRAGLMLTEDTGA